MNNTMTYGYNQTERVGRLYKARLSNVPRYSKLYRILIFNIIAN